MQKSEMSKIFLTISHPKIVKEWDYFKTGDLLPDDVSSNSRKKVWWRCNQGHEYQVSVHSRVRSNGCKQCQKGERTKKQLATKLIKSQTLVSHSPYLLNEWDYFKNNDKDPNLISFGSNIKVWWKCDKGHSWHASVKSRTKGGGCALCSYKLGGENKRLNAVSKSGISFAQAHPELLNEWDHDKNDFLPSQLSSKSSYRAFWRCKYGHMWEATIDNRTHNHSNCPECNPQTSRIEIYLLCEIRTIHPNTQWRRLIDGVECDIFIPDLNIGIEVDGQYWHNNKLQKDISKGLFFKEREVKLVRVRDVFLPVIDGYQISFNRNENLQLVSNRLIKYLTKFNNSFDSYPQKQQAESSFNLMISRLPAPPIGETLVDLNPEVAAQWDYVKNDPLVPDLFSKGSNQKFWWICSKGHSYNASINNRVSKGSDCPFCYELKRSEIANRGRLKKTQSLTSANPIYLKMFDLEKNTLHPSEIAIKSSKDIWWICEHGHSFCKKPVYMADSYNCPTCKSFKKNLK
jgi:hypothetical protein